MRSEEILRSINALPAQRVKLMEVCGTHTMSIARAGIKRLLPEGVELLSGPGCPVCVTPGEVMDAALELSGRENVTVAAYGDMLRVPGTRRGDDLAHRRARGADVRIVYSPMDALDTTFGYGVGICAAGLDALVAYQIPRFRRLPGCGGTMAYTLSILQVMTTRFGHRVRITLDGRAHTGNYMMAAVCNGRMYGGGYCAAPLARLDDGLLDVVLVRPLSRLQVPGLLARYRKGAHLTPQGEVPPDLRRWITFARAREVRIEVLDGRPIAATVDGECGLVQRIEAKAAPRALSMLLPAAVRARQTAVSIP